MAGSGQQHDHFPETHVSFIIARLGRGSEAEEQVRTHVMLRYTDALKAYYLGTSYRGLWEPDEIVNGFFLDRLQRKDFLTSWHSSGMRLRRWLMNAMCFYLREVCRSERRRAASGESDMAEESAVEAAQAASMDIAFRQTIVSAAIKAAQASCDSDGFEEHFRCFLSHAVDGRSCEAIGIEINQPADRVWVMVRTGQRRFVKALRQALMDDGTPAGEVDREIRELVNL